jgi:hypothetical protein
LQKKLSKCELCASAARFKVIAESFSHPALFWRTFAAHSSCTGLFVTSQPLVSATRGATTALEKLAVVGEGGARLIAAKGISSMKCSESCAGKETIRSPIRATYPRIAGRSVTSGFLQDAFSEPSRARPFG